MAGTPGLLQTQDYARALLANRIGGNPETTDEIVAARMARQSILARDNPPELWVVIDEAVLHRPVGGPLVMREQLNQLIKSAQRPSIVFQVIPAAVGVHDGLPGAGFIIATFENAPHVAYQDTAVRGQVIEDSDDIGVLMGTWDRLSGGAAAHRLPGPDRGSSHDMDLSRADWRKASYSSTNGGACVEVAGNLPGIVAVRDSKDPDGPVLAFSLAEWRAFAAGVKTGGYDLS
jgi:hypothetical protein